MRSAETVLQRIREIPEGFVRTYGDVCPGAPRHAGAVLRATDEPGLPWHRVVRADGSLAKGARQRALLEAEGVPFRGKRVDLRVARMITLPGDVDPARSDARAAPPGVPPHHARARRRGA